MVNFTDAKSILGAKMAASTEPLPFEFPLLPPAVGMSLKHVTFA